MNTTAFMDNLRQLFADCDSDNNGSLGREEFSELCAKIGLNKEAADETFERLDQDRDDRITFDEFAAGFNQYSRQATTTTTPTKPNPIVSKSKSPVPARFQTSATAGASTGKLSCPSPVAARSGRKSASPLGVMSLGSTGSSTTNLTPNGGQRTTSTTSDYSEFSGSNLVYNSNEDPVIVYSSDMIGDYDQHQQASGSGSQFGSLMSSNGSFSQLRNMQDLLECVQKLQSENQQLSQIFFKDKREREEYISQLGEEFDQQVREVEERASRRAREELENEKKRLREMMLAEREQLQHHYQTIEKMSKLIKSPKGLACDDGESIDKVKSKLEDTYLENRQLKRSLLDTKTDVAMIWKEMEKLKKQYEQKLSSAYERNNETRNECDHIKQQLNLMKDSNRKLQDASDVITTYITDKVEPVIKSATDPMLLDPSDLMNYDLAASQANSRRGSILSEYINGCNGEEDNDSPISLDAGCNNSTNGDVESLGSSRGARSINTNQTRRDEAIRKTSSSVNLDEAGSLTPQPAATKPKPLPRTGPIPVKANQLVQDNKREEAEAKSSIIKENQPTPTAQQQQTSITNTNKPNGFKNLGRHFFIGSRVQSNSQASEPDTKDTNKASAIVDNTKSIVDRAEESPLVEPSDGPSKFTFNIILVGDSFVGKSSFAARFMEGNFVQGLISNCSIDFKTKAYKVDGVNYTVNLWDTAGQERFRSITASYFRKADGIILMYDVTEKRSYLNVRNWMSTISDTASENVAVLLVGNKIDLRQPHNKDKCVPMEEGIRLAKEYEIVFLETSVKTGANLVPSMGKLIRLIAKNNTPVEEDTDRIKLNDKSKMFNCMPKNC